MKNQKTIFYLSIVWLFVILIMGGWWLYLMNYLSQQLISRGIEAPDIIRLTKWEGSTFIILILMVTFTLYYYYFRLIQKNQAMQAFFAALTHELKTPLASIRLQGEVINEMASSGKIEKLPKLCDRLTEDTNSLENQMDKVLLLSQVEKGKVLATQEINLSKYLEQKVIDYKHVNSAVEIILNDQTQGSAQIYVDTFALDLILRNLFENTKRHSGSQQIQITVSNQQDDILIEYDDGGNFNGDRQNIATLFAKGPKSKGSGIGLYLIKQLMLAMGGTIQFAFTPSYRVQLRFPIKSGDAN